jgi:hypothetical protein
MRIYKKLGFQECGMWTIEDLERHGGNKGASMVYIGMTRVPGEFQNEKHEDLCNHKS